MLALVAVMAGLAGRRRTQKQQAVCMWRRRHVDNVEVLNRAVVDAVRVEYFRLGSRVDVLRWLWREHFDSRGCLERLLASREGARFRGGVKVLRLRKDCFSGGLATLAARGLSSRFGADQVLRRLDETLEYVGSSSSLEQTRRELFSHMKCDYSDDLLGLAVAGANALVTVFASEDERVSVGETDRFFVWVHFYARVPAFFEKVDPVLWEGPFLLGRGRAPPYPVARPRGVRDWMQNEFVAMLSSAGEIPRIVDHLDELWRFEDDDDSLEGMLVGPRSSSSSSSSFFPRAVVVKRISRAVFEKLTNRPSLLAFAAVIMTLRFKEDVMQRLEWGTPDHVDDPASEPHPSLQDLFFPSSPNTAKAAGEYSEEVLSLIMGGEDPASLGPIWTVYLDGGTGERDAVTQSSSAFYWIHTN